MIAETAGRLVMVGVDGSEGAIAAVRFAARYARETGAHLRLMYAIPVQGTTSTILPTPGGTDTRELRWPERSGDRVLATAAAEAALYVPGVKVDGRTVRGAVPSVLVEASADAGLLVLGSRHRGRVASALFGSVSGRVAAEAHCPVVVVRGEGEPSGPVVVGVDETDSSWPALRFAFREAGRRRCAVFAIHAWQTPLMPAGVGLRTGMAAGISAPEESALAARQTLTDAMAPWRTAFPDVPVHDRLVEGDPAAAVAQETVGAALTVVGSQGRGPMAGLLLGSTSQTLLHMADCPVAVVGPSADERAA